MVTVVEVVVVEEVVVDDVVVVVSEELGIVDKVVVVVVSTKVVVITVGAKFVLDSTLVDSRSDSACSRVDCVKSTSSGSNTRDIGSSS